MKRALPVLLALALVASCDDDDTAPAVVTELTVDIRPCLGDAARELPNGDATMCRVRLDESDVKRVCFVLESDDGEPVRRLAFDWNPGGDPVLTPAGHAGRLTGAAGARARGALFFFDAEVDCGALGVEVPDRCDRADGCVLKLTQGRAISVDGAGSTRFEFTDGDGQCDSSWAETPGERCNGADDDCDGRVDEQLELGEPCQTGEGACERVGRFACGEDELRICDAAPGEPTAERCNQLDDDCDGRVDEETPEPCDCVPADETCNEADDDCDGEIDEGALNDCGACGEVPEEICDNEDNDCDGALDEGLGLLEVCESGMGACAVAGQIVCADDGTTECDAEPLPPQMEVCNGLDDNCNGTVDDVPRLGEACFSGFGECRQEGELVCDAEEGELRCSAEDAVAALEVCDGLDNDCNKRIDDVQGRGGDCTVGVGECEREGVLICDVGQEDLVCDATPGQPGNETCNGRDDDCDGVVDDVPGLGDRCSVGQGACEREGERVCRGGMLACDAQPGPPQAETCELTDQDCDGRIDEGLGLNAPCSVGVGECENQGQLVCNIDAGDGSVVCNVQPRAPDDSECNGLDNDCDGNADECPSLVINEIDVVQPGPDNAEFIEVRNIGASPASLENAVLEVTDERGETIRQIPLGPGALPAGAYLLAGQADARNAAPGNVRKVAFDRVLRNGQGAVRLLTRLDPREVVDEISYGAPIAGVGSAGAAPGDEAPNGSDPSSLGRCPDGADTDDNAADFLVMPATPGEPNDCPDD